MNVTVKKEAVAAADATTKDQDVSAMTRNLHVAAESRIRDTDMAGEMVQYADNQILAQAGQANQGVLSLLQ